MSAAAVAGRLLQRLTLSAALAVAVWPAGVAGASAEAPRTPLGRIDFPTSVVSAEAREHFERGVLWLHSFEYSDARQEFTRAREIEPEFAMAYWGEAMTHNHPIWVRVDVEAARWALQRLGETREERLAAAPTEREREYLAAVEALFFGDGDKVERDRAYSEAMGRIHRRYPDDHEAAAFYALSLLGNCQGERDFAAYMRSAGVVEEVYLENPDHPGALHYLIHSYDEPIHAPLGLRAARRYAKVAAAAPHALHMTSHIFLALGRWDETVSSNIDSWEASLARGGRNYHALYWLHYALMQQGRFADAAKRLERMAADVDDRDLPNARSHLAYMEAVQIVELDRPTDEPTEIDITGLGPRAQTAARFARGYWAAAQGDAEGAREMARRLRAGAKEEDGRAVGAARAVALQLDALAALASAPEDDTAAAQEAAIALLTEAAEIEDSLPLDLGPPNPPKPSWELLGETLLAAGQPAEARAAFERALELAPGRRLSLRGLAAAAESQGDGTRSAEARALLDANLHSGD